MTSSVVRHDEWRPGALDGHDLVVVGPGPGDPRDGDHPKIAVVREAVDALLAAGDQPFLAVCLGHQVLCERLGLPLAYKDIVFQGTQSEVDLFGRTERVGLLQHLRGPTGCCRRAGRRTRRDGPARPATSTQVAGRTSGGSSSTPSRSSPSTASSCCATWCVELLVAAPG